MGRAPCCDKANVKKGPWSPEEDAKLKSYIEQHGTGGNWIALPQKIGLKRCGKSCRLRWLNYLRPNLKHGGFSEEEDNIICSLYISIGSRWSVIAAQLPGRTDNDIKNYWNTRLKKKLLGKHRKEQQQQARIYNRGNNSVVKQESNIDRGSDGGGDCDSLLSLLVHENSTQQQPYWSQIMMPVLQPHSHTNQQLGPCFNDQDSIKKLLIKLEGRFSDDDYYHPTLDGFINHQFSSHGTLSTHTIYQEQVHVGSSACIIDNNTINSNNEVQFAQNNHQYCAQGDGFDLLHGQGGLTEAIEEMVSTNFPQTLNGLEFFYGDKDVVGDEIIIGTSTTTCSQRPNNWGETSTTPIYPPLVDSNYQGQGVREQTTQECALQEFSYPGER